MSSAPAQQASSAADAHSAPQNGAEEKQGALALEQPQLAGIRRQEDLPASSSKAAEQSLAQAPASSEPEKSVIGFGNGAEQPEAGSSAVSAEVPGKVASLANGSRAEPVFSKGSRWVSYERS